MYSYPRTHIMAALLLATTATSWAGPEPVVDLTTTLSKVTFYEKNGSDPSKGGMLRFNDNLIGAFLPKDAIYTGSADEKDRLFGVLRKAGRPEELYRVPFMVNAGPAVFSELQPYKISEAYTFADEGDYVLSFEFDGKAITELPFRVTFKQTGDEFNPQRLTLYDGEWNQWGVLVLPKGDPDQVPFFRTWLRGGVLNTTGKMEAVSLDIMHEGRGIYTAMPIMTGLDSSWNKADFQIRFLDAEGGGAIKTRNLLQKDGTYQVVLRRAERIYGVYSYRVQEGKIQPHARQAMNHEPRVSYVPGKTITSGQLDEVYWTSRLPDAEAERLLGQGPAAGAGPSDADRARWQVQPSYDKSRPFAVTLTQVATRMDSGLAAGDGIIAFGTGAMMGVSFLRVGENVEQSIPDGQSYSAGLFAVCGKKIVLVQGNAVHVFDTASGQTVKIPEGDIYLSRTSGAMYKPNPIAAGGNLVATLNDPKQVTDRAILKIIDVSADPPRIIAIRNADYAARDAVSAAVDPATGLVAVGSRQNKKLYVARVAPDAEQKSFDLSGHDAFGECAIRIGGGYVAYQDDSSEAKFRMLNIDTGEIFTAGPLDLGGWALRGARYAYPNKEPASAAAQYVLGTAPNPPIKPSGSGETLGTTNGRCGVAQSAAIAADGTVFLAGQAGIDSGDYLQAGNGQQWIAAKGPDGQPIPATDVVMGEGVLAFRTGKSNQTTIGYATLGETIDLAGVAP